MKRTPASNLVRRLDDACLPVHRATKAYTYGSDIIDPKFRNTFFNLLADAGCACSGIYRIAKKLLYISDRIANGKLQLCTADFNTKPYFIVATHLHGFN